ncbi:MAG: TIGR04255 family protein [Polaromonas sp.]|nr:TIGR04255 family protein [Polaromonas sp.]
MGTPLKNPPVYFTLVQVRFNAILKLSEYLPSIQDEMRKTGFPDFVTRKSMVLQIATQDGKTIPTTATTERFFFGTTDKKHCFVLAAEALTLQSTDYGTFEAFSAMFLKGLLLVNQMVQLDFTARVGLRYLDHVTPKNNDTLDDYLAEEVRGLSARLSGKALHSFTETLHEVDGVRLLSRVVIQDGSLPFPPDMQPEEMSINPRFLSYSGRHAMVDTDGFIEGREVFSADHIGKQLNAIHDVIRIAFRAVVTEHAFNVWDEK